MLFISAVCVDKTVTCIFIAAWTIINFMPYLNFNSLFLQFLFLLCGDHRMYMHI